MSTSDRNQFTTAALDNVEIVDSRYGKNYVKMLFVRKGQTKHYVKEVEVCTALTLKGQQEYLKADNSDIIATDSQKNTVYILAKQHGIESIEKFAVVLSNHFLATYPHVIATKISVEEYPWKRMQMNGKSHVHAFLFDASCKHICEVNQERDGRPHVRSGLRDLRVLKTTKSAFRNFLSDDYRTLSDTDDRIMSTVVTADWEYNTAEGFNFDTAWNVVRDTIIETFAGPPDTGVLSASVQHTVYLASKTAISRIPQISKIDITLPNKHYFDMDFTKFSKLETALNEYDDNAVYLAVDKPSGNIYASVRRSGASKL